jgi:DNA (cytosine-5)-methyltransferase 1
MLEMAVSTNGCNALHGNPGRFPKPQVRSSNLRGAIGFSDSPARFWCNLGQLVGQLKVGSLFSGIGGFDLGFERAGFQIKWQVEIDDYCQSVLARHWPDVQRYGDIRAITELPAVDVICGGFPCQNISNAGQRAGIDGNQSGLWSEMARIIRLVRPHYVVVENVSALLNRGMGRVLGDLSACGYDAEWDCIPACAVGAPHRRDRVWLVAYTERMGRGQHGNSSSNRNTQETIVACAADVADAERISGELWATTGQRLGRFAGGRNDVADATSTRWNGAGRIFTATKNGAGPFSLTARSDWWATEPSVGRVAHGVPARVDRLKGLGNAIVPQIAEWIARRILVYERSCGEVVG